MTIYDDDNDRIKVTLKLNERRFFREFSTTLALSLFIQNVIARNRMQ